MKREGKNKVLLHICCGVCAYYCIDFLQEKGYPVTGFFYNPNVEPKDEYLRRKKAAHRVAQLTKVDIIDGDYDNLQWRKACLGYENEEEGGQRCLICYEMRLKKALNLKNNKDFDFFATTLTISPYKDSLVICSIGKRIGGASFLPLDFKKGDGFTKTISLAKKENIYRQKYCGCLFSKG